MDINRGSTGQRGAWLINRFVGLFALMCMFKHMLLVERVDAPHLCTFKSLLWPPLTVWDCMLEVIVFYSCSVVRYPLIYLYIIFEISAKLLRRPGV